MGVNGIYGLSGSGMDIDSLVKVGMMSKQNEYDKMAQKYTKNEWLKADYLELSNSITTFNTSTLSQYKLSSNMNAKSAESTSSAIKASATSSAPIMSHTVEVKGLSANAYLIGTRKMTRYNITSDTVQDTSTKLADILFNDLKRQTMNGQEYVSGHVASVSNTIQNADYTSYTFGGVVDGAKYDEILSFGEDGWNDPSARLQHYNSSTNTWEDVTDNNIIPTKPDEPTITQPDPNDSKYYNGVGSPFNQTLYDQDMADYNNAWDTYNNSAEKLAWDKYQSDINSGDDATEWRRVIQRSKEANASIDDVAFSFEISDGNTNKEIKYTYRQLLDGNVTLTDLASKISEGSGFKVTARYDAARDRFTLYQEDSGADNKLQIKIGADTGDSTKARAAITARNFFDNLGLYQSQNGELIGQTDSAVAGDGKSLLFNLNGTTSFNGVDTEIYLDGVLVEGVTDNKFTADGVTYTALDTTKGLKATVNITQDTDAIIDKVKSFVADYNKLLSSLYEKYDEKPNSDYKPLTQSQKDSMKEEQITKWEEKAKKGMLYHDQTIGRIIQNMRSSITKEIDLGDGDSISIFSLGISTTGLKGQLKLDEDKLKQALAEDSDAVYKVFARLDPDNPDDADKSGVAQRLGDVFTQATKNIRSRAGSTADTTEDSDLNNLLRSLQTRMSNFKKMMTTFENALYKKYDAMESTLARLGTQLSFIMGGNS